MDKEISSAPEITLPIQKAKTVIHNPPPAPLLPTYKVIALETVIKGKLYFSLISN